MKCSLVFLLLIISAVAGAGVAAGVDMQPTPAGQNASSVPEKKKQDLTIGPRDLQKEAPRGLWFNFPTGDNTSVGCGLSVFSRDTEVQNRQKWRGGISDPGATQVEGCVGFRYQFK